MRVLQSSATPCNAIFLPYKEGVAGSNPASPTLEKGILQEKLREVRKAGLRRGRYIHPCYCYCVTSRYCLLQTYAPHSEDNLQSLLSYTLKGRMMQEIATTSFRGCEPSRRFCE